MCDIKTNLLTPTAETLQDSNHLLSTLRRAAQKTVTESVRTYKRREENEINLWRFFRFKTLNMI